MELDKNYKKGACQCRKCGRIFHNTEIEHIHTKRYEQSELNCVCPVCGSSDWGMMCTVRIKSDTWLYTDAKNYGDIDKYEGIGKLGKKYAMQNI